MSWSSLLGTSVLLAVIYYLIILPIYNIYFHPLRKYPGPKLFVASSLPWGFWYRSGFWHEKIEELHKQYGHIVRVAPDELSFDIPEAWDEIYCRQDTKIENRRPEFFISSKLHYIISAKDSDQRRMKNKHGLVHRPDSTGIGVAKKPINLMRWVNYLTFDIIGELLFGKTFGCVAGNERFRAWQDLLITNLQLLHTICVSKRIWIFWLAMPWRDVYTLLTQFTHFDKLIGNIVNERLAGKAPDRTDLFELMKQGRGGNCMTQEEILANSNLLTFAGSESSANSTVSLLYRISSDATLKARLLRELRANFKSEDEMTSTKAMTLPFLRAVIEEGLRLHPVTPNALWRITPKQGNKIFDDWIPGNTVLSIHHRAMYRSEHNFKRAQEFIPERWMPNSDIYSEFASDRRDAFHPFSCGPRMCPARNLGYAEISIILARILWNFEIVVAEESRHWRENLKGWVLWEKRPFWLYLIPREEYEGNEAKIAEPGNDHGTS
ncbi:uncharacterized protein MYCFIDRAFT_190535 [Pseudocercospora fijiensis CIRAD86]|uniref:Cytochrome P450 monooxygenase n=1 Tax=Pseudocercospora fijiensis (strain CIRAD86) TaxID=383855 RepID=M3AQT0_PSEFD|nr:uncharacterized protein MYCFIDRAFT_190535 [Pseudocercospora fijiensis CIRAD86]EME79757.1 hypothetical protein MYCFIDRAFT_190535 [Pseudocercospora fijiensis CIRAD86]